MSAAPLLVSMFLLVYAMQPRILSPRGLQLLLQASVPLVFAVMAQMLFILGCDINLGLGFAVGLAKIITPTFLVDAPLLGLLGLAAVVPGNVLMAVIV